MRPSTRHTSAQQTAVNQHLGFIVNRPRGHSANSVPYLAPPVLVDIPAFFARRRPLARGLLCCLGYIVAGSLTLLPTVAHIQMRTMLGSISLAVAARLSAGAVSFR